MALTSMLLITGLDIYYKDDSNNMVPRSKPGNEGFVYASYSGNREAP